MSLKVCIVGLGYIGLPTAAVLADKGFMVHGVDVNENAVNLINNGQVHIYEPDLEKVVKKVVAAGNLTADIDPIKADIYILAVPTPFKENHKPDLAYVESATKSIIPYIEPGNLIILESTSPVGTTEKIVEWILNERTDLSIDENKSNQVFVSHCPERVLPGKILKEIIQNDRIVGGINKISTQKTAEFYELFVDGKVLQTNAKTAELTKLTENSYRDVNIAFANELSMICDDLEIDVWELIKLANHHPRVNILQPGPGVGGHCIAVDPWFIVDAAPERAKLIQTARNVNDIKPQFVIDKVKSAISNKINPTIACLGLSFKANIDDLRESPAVEIVSKLASLTKNMVYVSEPHINELPLHLLNLNIQLSSTEDALKHADVVLLLVEHDYFKLVDNISLKNKVVIDTKGIFQINNEENEIMTKAKIK
ncbi:UDP-N-acetyl-D-mannosamine dehydrogenase [Peribacillus muralis]|uniref:UDP-N-acetyl-D-mannosamine dehydrogenase n=1 Tax=Peribacillus muralis TaxID=264697 RepID=UPI001F4D3C16|nr:UDP-N-acetyl-D-mannosamine dehydrogenase [Peribacillus muralis]MCK2012198.1 UDP-N-acetyl-D-mannosamine dehydrogenase [Peribacillus muralis]